MKKERLMELAGVQLSEAKRDYEDSGEFTDEFFKLESILRSERFKNWMEVTDDNMGTQCEAKYKVLMKAFEDLWEELNNAG